MSAPTPSNVPSENLLAGVLRRTHAGAALVGVAIVDQQLEDALLLKMRALNRELRDRLFTGYGPLSSLSAKIDVAFALQLLDSISYDRVTTARRIRNLFAHGDEWLSFESAEIAAMLSKLPAEGANVPNNQMLYLWHLSQVEAHLISVVGSSIQKSGAVIRPGA